MHKNSMTQSGFTLVELAIVITIIGLLAGGVLLGQDLIRGAQMQSLSAGFARYESAVKQFQKQYLALPGDFSEAAVVWGAAAGNPADLGNNTCAAIDSTTLSNPQQTCNGNGDGLISDAGSNIFTGNWRHTERFRSWQHLSNAGLVEGAFSGRTASASDPFSLTPGRNLPRAESDALGYDLHSTGDNVGSAWFFSGNLPWSAVLTLHSVGYIPVLTPSEALIIDEKLDDGRPGLGRVQTYKNTSTQYPGCASTDAPNTAEYLTAIDEPRCTLIYSLNMQQ